MRRWIWPFLAMQSIEKRKRCEKYQHAVNAPQFFRIHFKKKTISATKENGEDQSTGIRTMERVDGMLVMQGIEAGRAWSLVISEYTGKMSVSVAGDREGFVLFGACTPL